MTKHILLAVYENLEMQVEEFQKALEGIPDDELNRWKPAAAGNGGGEMNTLAATIVHTVHAAGWRIVHQVFGHDYPRDRESEFSSTATRIEIDELFDHLLGSFRQLMNAQPDIDLTSMPPTIRDYIPDWTRLDYLISINSHTGLHLGHAQITRQLWLAERGMGNAADV